MALLTRSGFGGVMVRTGGFDSLPHCGAIVSILTVTGQTHKQAYKDMAIVTVVISVIAAGVLLGVVALTA